MKVTKVILKGMAKDIGSDGLESLPADQPPQGRPQSIEYHEPVSEADSPSSKKGTSCIPCATNHLSTCSGLMAEALRFARTDGLSSTDVIERIGLCQDEMNAMERVDLRAEKVSQLGSGEKALANQVLSKTRTLRHDLEHMETVDDLEKLAAGMQTLRTEVGKQWVLSKVSDLPEDRQEKIKEGA